MKRFMTLVLDFIEDIWYHLGGLLSLLIIEILLTIALMFIRVKFGVTAAVIVLFSVPLILIIIIIIIGAVL